MERNEALERLREVYADAGADTKAALEALIPALKDSEDEVKEDLLYYLKESAKGMVGVVSVKRFAKWANWLEKQKEHISTIDAICLSAEIQKPYKDGNQWCILKGDNIQEGVVGFGNTQEDALVDFIRNVPIEKQKEQKPEFPLMNGDADLYFDEWRQHYQGSPTKRKCFEEGMRYAQRLQKPAEWSEEDVEKLAKIRASKSGTLKSEMTFYRQGIRDAFNYKGLRLSWKPSEEQMDTLRHAIISFSEMQDVDGLESLYADLKKL